MRYSKGSYQILLFGEYGDKLTKKTADSYNEASTIANQYIDSMENGSAVINRTIWNSKDHDNNWDYTQ